jgi:DNA-binding GntR family transcriptional regulator
VSSSEIRDVLDARLAVEQHAVRRVIEAGRHRELATELRAILARHDEPGARPDASRFTDLDQRFHCALVDAAGNALLTGFYQALRDRQLRMGVAALVRDPGRPGTILAEHAALADLMEAGDGDAAAGELARHIAATRAALTAL